jgi:TPR repeat protein
MGKTTRMALARASEPIVRCWQGVSVNPVCQILLVLVVMVGTAFLVARCCEHFSWEGRAARGDSKAQYLLGKRYFEQANSPDDYARAAGWIQKAADQGYAQAQTGLGLLYENGLGVSKNYGEALRWLRQAAAQGFPVAQNELGIMYAKGRGLSRNLDEASKWCRQAAVQGSQIARQNFELAEIATFKVIPELTTRGKKCYKRVTLQKVESDGVTVSYLPAQGGMGLAKLRLEDLPAELQQLCGYAAKTGISPDSAFAQIGAVATPL